MIQSKSIEKVDAYVDFDLPKCYNENATNMA